MKKLLLILLLPIYCFGQICDEEIKNDVYTGCYSFQHKTPTFIKYKLYKGGGDCSRKLLSFKSYPHTATHEDYAHSGLEIGHICNAEDYANDCDKEKETFDFRNAMAQYGNLNRGIWKTDETWVRVQSQTDSLHVIAGPGYTSATPKTFGSGVSIPDYCWKYVVSLSTGKVILCRWYTNLPTNNHSKDYSKEDLEKLIGFEIK